MPGRSSLLHSSLYAGFSEFAIGAVPPRLVPLECAEPTTIRLLSPGSVSSWGILLRTGISMHALRSDLRPLLLVRGLGGKQLAFRQYASRVRRVFLPGCSPDQVSDSIGHIMMENRSSRPLDLTRLTLESKG